MSYVITAIVCLIAGAVLGHFYIPKLLGALTALRAKIKNKL